MKNNCYCLFCQSFFTNEERFLMICPECYKKETGTEWNKDETKDE